MCAGRFGGNRLSADFLPFPWAGDILSGDGVTEYMSLFTADGFEGEEIACDEGELEWVPIEKIGELNLWEGG